jgi:YHS domain-containing protein
MIFKIALAVVLLYLFYRLARTWKRVGAPPKVQPIAKGEDLVEDPLCHTYVPVTHARCVEIDGKKVYFCSEKCLKQYRSEQKQA